MAAERDAAADASAAPLTAYQIVDVIERWDGDSEVRVPGGSCWHCGQAIAYCVQIRHVQTGEQHEIGTTCAERVGLDADALKRMLAAKYADDRSARAAWRRQANAETVAQAEADRTAQHGQHGTETRFASGCVCDECKAVAPHGIAHQARERYRVATRFFAGCRCLDCVDAVVTLDAESGYPRGYRIVESLTVIIELATGKTVRAKQVNTRYGRSWCVRDGQAWLPVTPKRRATQAKHGFVEAAAPWLVEGSTAVVPLGCPIVDSWGERIARPESASTETQSVRVKVSAKRHNGGTD